MGTPTIGAILAVAQPADGRRQRSRCACKEDSVRLDSRSSPFFRGSRLTRHSKSTPDIAGMVGQRNAW